jgi:hypothetical protein
MKRKKAMPGGSNADSAASVKKNCNAVTRLSKTTRHNDKDMVAAANRRLNYIQDDIAELEKSDEESSTTAILPEYVEEEDEDEDEDHVHIMDGNTDDVKLYWDIIDRHEKLEKDRKEMFELFFSLSLKMPSPPTVCVAPYGGKLGWPAFWFNSWADFQRQYEDYEVDNDYHVIYAEVERNKNLPVLKLMQLDVCYEVPKVHSANTYRWSDHIVGLCDTFQDPCQFDSTEITELYSNQQPSQSEAKKFYIVFCEAMDELDAVLSKILHRQKSRATFLGRGKQLWQEYTDSIPALATRVTPEERDRKKRTQLNTSASHHADQSYVHQLQKRFDGNYASTDSLSTEQRRGLLGVFVPSSFTFEEIRNEPQWHLPNKVCDDEVQKAFGERFANVSMTKSSLEKHINGQPLTGFISKKTLIPDDIDARMAELKELKRFGNTTDKLQQRLKASTEPASDKIVIQSILTILQKQGGEISANGSSSYAELTGQGMRRIADELRMLKVTKDDVVMDLGSGLTTALFIICHHLGCRGIGVEYCSHRYLLSCQKTKQLLSKLKGDPHLNSNVANFLGDMNSMTRIPTQVTVIYVYDEAFFPELMAKMFKLLKSAHPGLRYVVSAKAQRERKYDQGFQEAGYKCVQKVLGLVKHGSNTGSSFRIYRRTAKPDTHVVKEHSSLSGRIEREAQQYWDLSVADKIQRKGDECVSVWSPKMEIRTSPRHLKLSSYRSSGFL